MDLETSQRLEKLTAKEDEFWDEFVDENSMANDLLDMAISLLKEYKALYSEATAVDTFQEHIQPIVVTCPNCKYRTPLG